MSIKVQNSLCKMKTSGLYTPNCYFPPQLCNSNLQLKLPQQKKCMWGRKIALRRQPRVFVVLHKRKSVFLPDRCNYYIQPKGHS